MLPPGQGKLQERCSQELPLILGSARQGVLKDQAYGAVTHLSEPSAKWCCALQHKQGHGSFRLYCLRSLGNFPSAKLIHAEY